MNWCNSATNEKGLDRLKDGIKTSVHVSLVTSTNLRSYQDLATQVLEWSSVRLSITKIVVSTVLMKSWNGHQPSICNESWYVNSFFLCRVVVLSRASGANSVYISFVSVISNCRISELSTGLCLVVVGNALKQLFSYFLQKGNQKEAIAFLKSLKVSCRSTVGQGQRSIWVNWITGWRFKFHIILTGKQTLDFELSCTETYVPP